MTLPLPTAIAPTQPAPPLPSVTFPITWILAHASAPIQYRSINDIVRGPAELTSRFGGLPYSFRPALEIALQQGTDGTWNQSMFGLPSSKATRFEGLGTMHAVRRLLECGWDRESPPLVAARRLLFRLLAEDDDPQFLFETMPPKGRTPEMMTRARQMLREAAAALLAQAGYENDPRLRGAARRSIDRIHNFLKSPLGQKPFIRVGNQQVLSADAAPPSWWVLWMLGFMPHFRSEHHEQLNQIYKYISQPMPRQEPIQILGSKMVTQPHLVLGDHLPHRNAVEDDVPKALAWLELMARLNFLKRNDNWTKMFERFVDDRDREGVWHPHKGLATPRSSDPFTWGMFPLEPAGAGGDERWTDVTFRIGLIARLGGRPIELT